MRQLVFAGLYPTDSADYTDLLQLFDWPNAYSYVYYGQAGYLDHALSSRDLRPQIVDARVLDFLNGN